MGEADKEEQPADAQLTAHGAPHAHQPEPGREEEGQRQPDAPHADEVQHKAAGAVARALHRAAGHDAGPEHRLGKGFDAQHPRAQRDDSGVGGASYGPFSA